MLISDCWRLAIDHWLLIRDSDRDYAHYLDFRCYLIVCYTCLSLSFVDACVCVFVQRVLCLNRRVSLCGYIALPYLLACVLVDDVFIRNEEETTAFFRICVFIYEMKGKLRPFL